MRARRWRGRGARQEGSDHQHRWSWGPRYHLQQEDSCRHWVSWPEHSTLPGNNDNNTGETPGYIVVIRLSETELMPDLPLMTPSPGQDRRTRFSSRPADRGRGRGAGQDRRRRTSSEPAVSPASALYQPRSTTVHLYFPLDRGATIPEELSAGVRPPFPYPFTGPVEDVDRREVQQALVRDWEKEYFRQLNPTVGSVARVLQLQAMGRWLDGWRRSRRTGNWLFFGRNPSPTRLISETQVVGNLRGAAAARILNQEKEGEERGAAEERAGRHVNEAAARAGEKVSV